MEWILIFLMTGFAGVTLLQVLIWCLFPARFVWRKQVPDAPIPDTLPPISVVICARNEANALRKHLPLILEQRYPGPLEVLVVNDDSNDETGAILADLSQKYSTLRVLNIHPKIHPGKKYALEQGIQSARYEWIAVTDADCAPSSPYWLAQMRPGAQGLILGYGPLQPTAGWLNRWARYETLYTALQYFSTAWSGWPFMGVGRNMIWHRSFFEAAGGFSAHRHIASGDDDLFVNSIAEGNNTGWRISPDTFMYSAAKKTLPEWIRQKRRHLSAGTAYKTWHSLVLGGVAFTHAVHYGLGAILLIIAPEWWEWVLTGYLLRMVVVWPVTGRACAQLHERGLAVWVPILDGLMAVWLGAVAPVLLLSGGGRWR